MGEEAREREREGQGVRMTVNRHTAQTHKGGGRPSSLIRGTTFINSSSARNHNSKCKQW